MGKRGGSDSKAKKGTGRIPQSHIQTRFHSAANALERKKPLSLGRALALADRCGQLGSGGKGGTRKKGTYRG